jgi:hypothetical protein
VIGGLGDTDRTFPVDHDQRLEHGRVAAAPGDQGTADGGQDVGAIREHLAGLVEIAAAQIFEHDGEIVGQFAGRQFETRPLVDLFEFDHGFAAITAFAVEMLEQM